MKLKQSLLTVALGTAVLGQAHAGFYVSDDAPVTAIRSDVARKDKTVYASFVGSRLQGTSRGELETVVDSLPNVDSVVVTTFVRTAKQMTAANRRIAAVKSILIRKGIPADRLTGNAELDRHADSFDTDVQVIFRSDQRSNPDASRPGRFAAPALVQHLPAPAPAYAYTTTSPVTAVAAAQANTAPQGQNAATLEFVKKIMAMASSKLISQESAVKLVNEYLANMAPVASQNPAGSASQAASPILPATPLIVPFGEVPRVWTLAANKSLRDNIRDWAITSGYSEPTWAASNPYQITYTKTYTGTFLEVLNQVASEVPSIDFKVSRGARRIDVVDHI